MTDFEFFVHILLRGLLNLGLALGATLLLFLFIGVFLWLGWNADRDIFNRNKDKK